MFRAELPEAGADGNALTFEIVGLNGMNFVMRDRQTGSRWQQATGEAIAGPLKGKRLELYPFLLTTWKEWRRRHPETLALVPDSRRSAGYERMRRVLAGQRIGRQRPLRGLLREDSRLSPHEQIIGLEAGGAHKAYPLERLKRERVISDEVGGEPVVLIYEVGSETTTAFSRRLDGRVLSFNVLESAPVQLLEEETGSVFNHYGECIRGPLRGKQLDPITPLPSFRFSWAEFFPQTEIYMDTSD